MATATKTFSGYTSHYLQLDVTDTGEYSIENNTSKIQYRVSLNKISTSTGAWSYTSYPVRFYVDGSLAASDSVPYDMRDTYSLTLLSGTMNVAHNSDGKKTISVYASYTTSGNLGSATTDAMSISLVDIPLYEKAYIKTDGEYKSGYAYVKVNGVWQKAKKIFIKVNGEWKESVVYV